MWLQMDEVLNPSPPQSVIAFCFKYQTFDHLVITKRFKISDVLVYRFIMVRDLDKRHILR